MRIVVLDGYTLNPGDLQWTALEQLGNLDIYDRTPINLVVERAKDAEVILTNKTPLPATVLEQLPQLKFISVLATGYNIVDIEAAQRLGIRVSNVRGYSTASVVQVTFALLLELTHHVQRHSDAVHAGKWSRSADFSFWDFPLVELASKTMGIIGFGDIGSKVADVASAFGMQVMAYSRTQSDQSHRPNFKWVALSELFSTADVVSLHCPLTAETQGIVNESHLRMMKPSAFLINTSRGPLVVEEDLARALKEGWIAGAGLDVLGTEPPAPDHVLWGIANCLITPHIAWASLESRGRLMAETVENVRAFLEGRERNRIV
ncbi:D-2-hydroxyacid dehydrogenase [Flavihumibacter rivuli]|uniref:D-2-hydroxyacid dehydrogenase n=1 Tax=Flavihumibacter rivuli TaxID=2838156 RepID=UPI001BDE0D00|nr:D-2-hydroxyacid dehydrogenase [Flavihumibacter rivuli]ULQ57682.1 D-2-hydroxyacid dehydrogenase [Flavihumibacter rivuli]